VDGPQVCTSNRTVMSPMFTTQTFASAQEFLGATMECKSLYCRAWEGKEGITAFLFDLKR
jgi:hypothetical protein